MALTLEKYHGLGNDYLVYDPARNDMELNSARIRLICDRNFGVGGDGILFGPIDRDGRPAVRIFNPDGSEAEKSGNGVRIFSRYLRDFGYVKDHFFVLATKGGDVDVRFLGADGGLMRVLMGRPTFASREIPVAGRDREVVDEEMLIGGRALRVTCVSVGNPHCVIPLPEISKALAIELGSVVETAPQFPNRINMQLLRVIDRRNIALEIFERGAGYTLASGSSSCAAACAARRLGLVDERVTVHMPGGDLEIEMPADGSVYMTGPVERVAGATLAAEFENKLRALVGGDAPSREA